MAGLFPLSIARLWASLWKTFGAFHTGLAQGSTQKFLSMHQPFFLENGSSAEPVFENGKRASFYSIKMPLHAHRRNLQVNIPVFSRKFAIAHLTNLQWPFTVKCFLTIHDHRGPFYQWEGAWEVMNCQKKLTLKGHCKQSK